ncbi:hypothetical protein DMC47_36940 [Nostoc sp. 3335mG]|nr:hypothetical protein DMC47_36940 [Nostoc sp. 3335mG]
MTRRVWDLAHGRSGDKGDVCNIGLIARSPAAYQTLLEQVTPERVRTHFNGLIKGSIERFELPNIHAINFVCRGALDGGGTLSLRSDHLGKVMYTWLLRMELDDA